jgi:hypothetical protein
MANDRKDALPGNPFYGIQVSDDSAAMVAAILAVAHELRTANLQRQAAVVAVTPDFTDVPENDYALWEALQQQVASRLGYVAP